MYKLLITASYRKRAKKFFKKNHDLIDRYEKILQLMCINPHHPSLRLHKLTGNMAELFSVSINLRYRLIIYLIIKDHLIMPVDIGSHDEVY